MKLGIHQPYFFPYIGYFCVIANTDIFLLHDKVQFKKQSWICRNRLLIKSNQSIGYIRPDLEISSSNLLINEVLLKQNQWKQKLLKTIHNNYKNTPYYDETRVLIVEIFQADFSLLSNFNIHSIRALCSHLNIKTSLVEANETLLQKTEPSILKGVDKKTQRIINICNELQCTQYINAIGGKDIYNKDDFNLAGIKLRFIQFSHKKMISKIAVEMDPSLSIIHTLCHAGKEGTKALLQCTINH